MPSIDHASSKDGNRVLDERSLFGPVMIPINGEGLGAELVVPMAARGIVLVTWASGCIRETPRVRLFARALEARGFGTLLLHLLTAAEAARDTNTGKWSFDLDLLTFRLLRATHWIKQQPATRALSLGYLGSGPSTAAALIAAAQLGYAVQAVVSRGGRPNFAADSVKRVTAPTLLIVGERDETTLQQNRQAFDQLVCRKDLQVVPGADHLFDEPGTLEQAAKLAADWFSRYLQPPEPKIKARSSIAGEIIPEEFAATADTSPSKKQTKASVRGRRHSNSSRATPATDSTP